MAHIRVRLFARLRERAGQDIVAVELPVGATVGSMRQTLARHWPDLASLIARSAVAVNEVYADDDVVIGPGDDVALIPPVSGGSLDFTWCD
jgi:molybdopterin synthase catalytic subunit